MFCIPFSEIRVSIFGELSVQRKYYWLSLSHAKSVERSQQSDLACGLNLNSIRRFVSGRVQIQVFGITLH